MPFKLSLSEKKFVVLYSSPKSVKFFLLLANVNCFNHVHYGHSRSDNFKHESYGQSYAQIIKLKLYVCYCSLIVVGPVIFLFYFVPPHLSASGITSMVMLVIVLLSHTNRQRPKISHSCLPWHLKTVLPQSSPVAPIVALQATGCILEAANGARNRVGAS